MLKFLNLKPEIFGIDINDLSLRIVKLQKRGGSFNLVSFNETFFSPGIVKEGVIQDEQALVKIIKTACNAVKGKKLDTKYVVVSLPEEKSFAQVIQMPKMTNEELKLAVPFEAENYIPLSVNTVYLDFQVIDYHEPGVSHMDLLINVMAKSIVDSYVSCFKKAGLVPCILEVESQAIIRALMKNNEKDIPAVFVDFGETKTNLIIYSNNSIRFTVIIPISSGQLTEAISEKLGVGFNEAEKLKVQYGLDKRAGKEANNLISAMSPLLNDLAEQIKKYINFYQGHAFHEYFSSNEKVKKVVLCGGGANLKELAGFLSKNLKIPVELGNPLLSISQDKTGLFTSKKILSFTTAIGTALKGAGDTYLNSYGNDI